MYDYSFNNGFSNFIIMYSMMHEYDIVLDTYYIC